MTTSARISGSKQLVVQSVHHLVNDTNKMIAGKYSFNLYTS
nr:hypothetical protein [Paenibacillus profundus]